MSVVCIRFLFTYGCIIDPMFGSITGTVSTSMHSRSVPDDAATDTEKGIGEDDSATPLVNVTWRHYPHEPREVMVIGSYGDLKNWLQQKLVL